MKDKQYMIMILDGVGLNDEEKGNAFKLAKTPNIDRLINEYPNSYLKTSGLAVGLPDGQMGNSEVGHMTIGSGRVIFQDLTLISKEIAEGKFFKNDTLVESMQATKTAGANLHVMGLLSPGGVHSHIEHMYAIIELAKKIGIENVFIHCITDGRDTPTSAGVEYIRELENKCKQIGVGKIATIVGRYYTMDRNKKWDRVEKGYRAMTVGDGAKFKSAEKAIENSYEAQVFDEFVLPINIVDDKNMPIGLVKPGDCMIFANFRPDRARQITHAFCDNVFDGFDRPAGKIKNLRFVCMTQYDETIKNVKIAYKKEKIVNTLGQFLEKRGYKQLRIAETEKYAHVTFFFNGGEEVKTENETRILIPSPQVATYDLKPEMSAYEITDEILKQLDSKQYDVIIVNYANGDMVGHTGSLEAAIKAVEALDSCVEKVITKLVEMGGEALIIADHGNCEEMIDLKTGEPLTTHTTFDVPVIAISERVKSIKPGTLSDVAPTLIDMMGLVRPKDMTGTSILQLNK